MARCPKCTAKLSKNKRTKEKKCRRHGIVTREKLPLEEILKRLNINA